MNILVYLLDKYFDRLINLFGLGVLGIIDIGSAGNVVPMWEKKPYLIKKLLRFEPRESKKILPNITTFSLCVWKRNTVKTFYVYKGMEGRGSSLFYPNYKYVEKNYKKLRQKGPTNLSDTWFERSVVRTTKKISCRTLDSILGDNNLFGVYDVLKIDAQGAEYEILMGAMKYLKQDCVAVFLETFSIPLYKGIKMFPSLDYFLTRKGFYLAKKFSPHGSFDSQNDCLYLKRGADKRKISLIKKIYGV